LTSLPGAVIGVAAQVADGHLGVLALCARRVKFLAALFGHGRHPERRSGRPATPEFRQVGIANGFFLGAHALFRER
jgi:hypothetical protein